MNTTPDILLENKTLLVSEARLLDLGYTAHALRSRRNDYQTGKLNSWGFKTFYNQHYYLYDMIPNSHRLGSKELLEKLAEPIESDTQGEIIALFESEVIANYKQSDEDWYTTQDMYKVDAITEAKELAMSKYIIVLIKEWVSTNKQKDFGIGKMMLWEIMSKATVSLCPKIMKHSSAKSLMNKVKSMPDDEQELRLAIIPKTKGNQNRRKVGRPENRLVNPETGEVYQYDMHQYLIFMFWMNPLRPNKLRKKGVYDKYVAACKQSQIEPVSLSTAKVYINQNRHWMSLERDGEAVFNDKVAPYISQLKAQKYCSLWVADWSGTKLLYYDKSSRKVKSLYMLRITDVATNKIVGWELVKGGEPAWAVRSALKKAIQFTDGYGCGEFVTDNGGAWKEDDTAARIKAVAKHHRRIAIGNKQANKAETYVRLLSEFARQFDNWNYLGFAGQHGSIDNVHNPDYLNKELLPDETGCVEQVAQMVTLWNDEKGTDKPYSDKIECLSELKLRRLNGIHTVFSLANSRGILKPSHEGVTYEFDLSDYDAIIEQAAKHTKDKAMKVEVVFDHKQADLYSPDWQLIASVLPLQKSHSTVFESTPDTIQGFESQKAKKEDFKTAAKDKVNGVQRILEDLPYQSSYQVNKVAKEAKQEHELHEVEEIEIKADKTNHEKNEDIDIDALIMNQM